MKIIFIILFVAILGLVARWVYQNSIVQAQGVDANSLKKCHSFPNCISSVDSNDDLHYYPSVKLNEILFKKLLSILQSKKNINIEVNESNYIHAIASSKFGFKDDIEFYFDSENKSLQIRSSSRAGRTDFGVNRKRMDVILKQLND